MSKYVISTYIWYRWLSGDALKGSGLTLISDLSFPEGASSCGVVK